MSEPAGRDGGADKQALASRIEQSYRRRIAELPAATRMLLVLAAAEPAGDVILLWNAAGRLGVGPEAASPAENADLIKIGTDVLFRHPLARAAAYRAAGVTGRRRAHGALAEATDPATDPDRRAWHRALAAVGPDEEVADELERSAARARARGGVSEAAALLQRATELTSDPGRRGIRALAAAAAKLDAASPDSAAALIATADLCPLGDLDRAYVVRLRAQVALGRHRSGDAVPLLLEAARRLEPFDAAHARETHLDTLGTAIFAGRLSAPGVAELGRAARSAPRGPEPPRTVDLLLDGLSIRYAEGFVAGAAALRRAMHAVRQDREEIRGLELASRFASELWEDGIWEELATRYVRLARSTGALAALPTALAHRSITHIHAGELAIAAALIEEAAALTALTGESPVMYCEALLVAWRGDRDRLPAILDLPNLIARGEGRGLSGRDYLLALLGNGLGDHEAALAAAQAACQHDDLDITAWSLVELVEAAARCGRLEAAATALERLSERARACPTDWALGIEARSRALLSVGPDADDLYREALARLGRTRVAVHQARAHLVYGEWLRREDRRPAARRHLRAAHDMLSRFGADGFADRARRELRATGERVPERAGPDQDVLTPREAHAAQLASEGHTTAEIGAQLLVSARTADHYLRKVYTKLGVRTADQLRDALAQERPSSDPTG